MKRDKYLLANLGHRYRHAHRRFSSVRRRPTPPAPQNGSKSTFARPVSPLCVFDTCPPRAEVYLVPYSRQFAVEGGVAQQLEEVGRRKPKTSSPATSFFGFHKDSSEDWRRKKGQKGLRRDEIEFE